MTRYQLGKLVEIAGVLQTRKRIQKVVHLLQAAGCPIEANYRLHYFGPYSTEVASLLNELVEIGLLDESCSPTSNAGKQFSYSLTTTGAKHLADFELSSMGRTEAQRLEAFSPLTKKLLSFPLWALELCSTLVYYRQKGRSWDDAIESTCAFKNVEKQNAVIRDAEKLAREIIN